MLDKVKQLMEMKKQAEELRRQLDASRVEVTDVPGIKIVISGSQNFQSIDISDELLDNKARVKGELLRSMNAAIKRSQDLAAQKMKAMTGLNIPGL